jgi:hypothetical protein
VQDVGQILTGKEKTEAEQLSYLFWGLVKALHRRRGSPLTQAWRKRCSRPRSGHYLRFDDGQKLLEAAEKHRLEGVVSKRRSAPYRPGACGDWLKVKTIA